MSQPNSDNEDVEMRNEDAQAGSSGSSRSCKNPKEIDVVITHVFGFLSFEDLKNCRLVSPQWSRIGKTILQKKSMILVDVTTGTTSQYVDTFAKSATKAKFSAFKFERCNGGWKSEVMDSFFRIYRRYIGELQMHLKDPLTRYDYPLNNFDVSHWLHRSKITKLCLTAIRYCRWKLSLCHVPGLTELHVNFGKLIFQPGLRLRLNKLDIFEAYFYLDDRVMDTVFLHNYIDFTNATHVRIVAKTFIHRNKLSLTDFINVDTLHLEGVTVIDWATANCTIRSLTISQNKIVEPTDMKITDLTIKSGTVYLYCLPHSVERLCLYSAKASIFSVKPKNASVLPNLKSLHVQVESAPVGMRHVPFSFLRCLRKSPKFVNFSVGGKMGRCELCRIPPTVRNVRCEGPALTNYGRIHVKYQKVVLLGVTLPYALRMLKNGLTTNVLVLECKENIFPSKAAQVISILSLRNFIIYMGRFNWNAHSKGVKSNALEEAGLVNTKAEYYRFVMGRGKPISKKQFNALKKLKGK